MKLFINDIFIEIIPYAERPNSNLYDHVLDVNWHSINYKGLQGKVLLVDADQEEIKKLIIKIEKEKIQSLKQLTILVEDRDKIKEKLKGYFTFIKAAGGVVVHNKKWLLIYRRKKWDLPKGKVDDGESIKEAAIREIEEECNLKVTIKHKICTTWHNYRQSNQIMLKKTVWYWMETTNPDEAKPQEDEDIEKVVFLDIPEVEALMNNSFDSIRYVIEVFKEHQLKPDTLHNK